ncbi:hypothetical protein ACXYMU_13260 [Pontibacter sp. CAU 1760]
MPTLIQVISGTLVLAFPIVFFQLYLWSLKKKANQIITLHTTESSELFQNLKVWVKNFDILEKTNKFNLDSHQTTYDYNECDLIVNADNLVVIGKAKLMGKSIYLTPTVLPFNRGSIGKVAQGRIVDFNSLSDNGSDLEIGFTDPAYKKPMTLVLKRVNAEMKNKIITRYNKSYSA